MPTASASASRARRSPRVPAAGRPRALTANDYARARRLLLRRDPILAAAIRRIGPCGLAARQRADHLSALVGAIVSQQLSTKAAATIYGRLVALFPGGAIPGWDAIAAVDDGTLRGVGLSVQKVSYVRDLCARVGDGRLRLDTIHTLQDEDVIEHLTSVRGFGRWTAEMFLMFRLHRPDVLPVGDLGIQTAMQRLYRMRQRPKPDRMQRIGEAWRPYRSVACWYLWQTLHNTPA
jgi:DNA-3-methyladenine glycosylase II